MRIIIELKVKFPFSHSDMQLPKSKNIEPSSLHAKQWLLSSV